ncbi:NAD-dependent epimerase/dehydratase family protein [Brevundimonas sp.]|jgi:UDP-glucose 4-epimerase|uniref:NAD-dependent epimerase/dehydratase family protein n=1 Tax=Brevundimonas sp. TaxID=1871086 RepID=UPI002E0FBFC0|nr:NAD-dependent epimerase/dehydratase family protein [Brevundimonas sp.]
MRSAGADSLVLIGGDGFVGPAVEAEAERRGLKLRSTGVDDPHVEAGDRVLFLHGLAGSLFSEANLRAANVEAVARCASAARRAGAERFVLLGSISVHGRSSPDPIDPDSGLRPKGPYARSRADGETALAKALTGGGTGWAVVRAPMVYGEPGAGFGPLSAAVARGLPLPLAGAVAPRSFCGVENLASALVTAALCDRSGTLIPADADDLDARTLCRLIGETLGRPARLLPAPGPLMRPLLTVLGRGELYDSLFEPMTVDRAHWRDWNWEPATSPREAIDAALPRKDGPNDAARPSQD